MFSRRKRGIQSANLARVAEVIMICHALRHLRDLVSARFHAQDFRIRESGERASEDSINQLQLVK
ncbi:hypothetical protein Scep_023829 [Stephania cephalantha]|uniref:Uncharacterized protein n=1 Tax=Stephania cephalantha TaxID=152367 RepID=A0AAP0EVW5_9MAGN